MHNSSIHRRSKYYFPLKGTRAFGRLVSDLGQEVCKDNLEQLVVPGSKESLKVIGVVLERLRR